MTDEQDRRIAELYLEMYKNLLQYAKAKLNNDLLLAEEVVQETFRIACTKPEDICTSKNPQGWLKQTLKFVIQNEWRTQASVRDRQEVYNSAHEMDAVSEDKLNLSLLYGNLSGTEEFRLVKEMALEGKSQQEIAEERGISLNACKKRIQRAKMTLRKKILN